MHRFHVRRILPLQGGRDLRGQAHGGLRFLTAPVRIVPFEPALAPHFARLNREWIERFFVLEPADLAVLADPVAAIIDPGGMIFFALLGEEVVGTCAVMPQGPVPSS